MYTHYNLRAILPPLFYEQSLFFFLLKRIYKELSFFFYTLFEE